MRREEYAIILEYLPHGYPLERKMMPIAQAIGESTFALLELIPRTGVSLDIGERVYIGGGKRDKIYYIKGKLDKEKISESAKIQMQEIIGKSIKEDPGKFIQFFNESGAINKRIHQIELLPGFGKKHMKEIITEREKQPFESFEDMKKRIQNLPDPERAIEKRIIKELTEFERHHLFVQGI